MAKIQTMNSPRRKCLICPCHMLVSPASPFMARLAICISVYTSCPVCPAEHMLCYQCAAPYRPCVCDVSAGLQFLCFVHVFVLFVLDSVKPLPRILCKNVIKYPCPNLSGRSSIVDNLQVHSCLAYPYRAASWLEVEASKRKSQERKVCSQVVQQR